jgi:hypothetical protein
MSTRWLSFAALWMLMAPPAWGAQDELMQLRGAVHVHSDFSTGSEPLETVARRALEHGLDVLVMGDDGLRQMDFGLPLLRNLAFTRDQRSLLTRGTLGAYLAEIQRLDQLFPELIVIDGVESAPFYFWGVDWLARRGTLRHWNKHLLAIGLGTEQAYRGLPVQGSPALWVWHTSGVLLLWPLIGLLYASLARRAHPAWVRYPVALVSALCLVNNFPFKAPLWDAYGGDMGAAPYQHYIDYVGEHRGLVFWAHPESRSTMPTMQLMDGRAEIVSATPAHGQDLLATRGYTGFAALYGDRITATEPGNQWDQVLCQYLDGERQRPVWGTGDIDYHHDDADRDNQIHDIQTVFLVRERTRAGVLEAMEKGRMYAARGGDQMLVLETFSAHAGARSRQAGETLEVAGEVRLDVVISRADASMEPLDVRLIKAGEVVAELSSATPFELHHIDTGIAPGQRSYYRLMARSRLARLTSNPIFVHGVSP